MQEVQSLLVNMQARADSWKNAGDQKDMSFLGIVTGMMSQNMYQCHYAGAIHSNADWVGRLTTSVFPEYYFENFGTLLINNPGPFRPGPSGRQVHDASLNPEINVPPKLVIGGQCPYSTLLIGHLAL